MKRSVLTLLFLLCISFFSCVSVEKQETDSTKENEALKIKLEATEAQLLNVRAELSKCKGESVLIQKDSLVEE